MFKTLHQAVLAYRRLRHAGATILQAAQLAWTGTLPISGGDDDDSGVKHDWVNREVARQALAPQSVAGTTVLGVSIDCQDLTGTLGLMVEVGANATSVDAKLQESDLTGSGFADCAIPAVITQITTANQIQKIKAIRQKRFVKVSVTTVGTAVVSAVLQGYAHAQ
jgi:hypothetical protein